MTDKTIMSIGNVGSDCFYFKYLRSSPYKLEHYLKFDPNDYLVHKSTGKQREVSYNEFLDFNYSQYIFFKKSKYNNIEINKWIDFLYQYISIPFFNKPFPPIEMIDKIKIKK